MSLSAIKARTNNFGFALINFNFLAWHDTEHTNWKMIDALLASMGAVGVRGAWANNTAYLEGDRVVDPDTSQIYVAQVDHTSNPTGTFDDERTANPTYWQLVTSLPVYRGTWQPGISYATGDIVHVLPNAYYFCVSAHTSSATFATDAARWTLTFDAQPSVVLMNNLLNDAQDARDAAEGFRDTAGTYANNANNSAIAANTHRANAVTAQNNAIDARDLAEGYKDAAAGSASAASTSASNAAGSASTATTQAGNAATSATNANNSANAANTAKIGAETARDKAQEWATKAENSPVETGQYSAFHWAAKAAASAVLAATFDPANYFTKTESDNRFANITGDIFTGNVTIPQVLSGYLNLRSNLNGNATPVISMWYSGLFHWQIVIANGGANSGEILWRNGDDADVKWALRTGGSTWQKAGASFGGNLAVGTAAFNVDGNHYMAFRSQWMSDYIAASDNRFNDRVYRVGYGDWSENATGIGWNDLGAKYICGIHVNATAPWVSVVRSLRVYQYVTSLGGWAWAQSA